MGCGETRPAGTQNSTRVATPAQSDANNHCLGEEGPGVRKGVGRSEGPDAGDGEETPGDQQDSHPGEDETTTLELTTITKDSDHGGERSKQDPCQSEKRTKWG